MDIPKPKNDRVARLICAIAPVVLSKNSISRARAKLEEENEHRRAVMGVAESKLLDGVLDQLARSEVEYDWQAWIGAVFSHPKWREEWAGDFEGCAGLADLEPSQSFIVEPVAHDHLVESAKAALEKIAAEYHPKVLRFCHAITAAPKAEAKKDDDT